MTVVLGWRSWKPGKVLRGESWQINFKREHGPQAGTEAQSFFLTAEKWWVMQEHIKAMTTTFDGLLWIGDPVSEEDHVVHLLASLPLIQHAGYCSWGTHRGSKDRSRHWVIITWRLEAKGTGRCWCKQWDDKNTATQSKETKVPPLWKVWAYQVVYLSYQAVYQLYHMVYRSYQVLYDILWTSKINDCCFC